MTFNETDTDQVHKFPVNADKAWQGEIELSFARNNTSTATEADYTLSNCILTDSADSCEITIIGDNIVEVTETLDLQMALVRNQVPTSISEEDDVAEIEILDDDMAGVVVDPTSLTINEGSSKTYTVKLTSDPTASVTVGVSVPTGTDVSASPTSLTFTSSNWSTAQTVTVSVATDADAVVDDQVTITHSVSSTGDYNGKTASSVVVSITETTVPVLSIGNASALENAGTMSFTVGLSVASSEAVTVNWVTADGTAEAGKDYTAVTDGSVTFSSGDDLSQAISVTISDDTIYEGNETFKVTLSNAVNATLSGGGNTLEATGTITENDTAPTSVRLSLSPAMVSEGDGTTTVTVTATIAGSVTLPDATTVTVSIGATADSATEGTDYGAVSDVTVTIAANSSSVTGTFTITPSDDEIAEGEEKVSVNGTATGFTVTSADLKIMD